MANKRNVALAKLTGIILAVYLLFSWLWIELIALSHQQYQQQPLMPNPIEQQRSNQQQPGPLTSQVNRSRLSQNMITSVCILLDRNLGKTYFHGD